jgi:UDP-2,3-diacylglucosamine pyrophosphatase LpxH
MSQPDKFLDFIKSFECEKLYLVGDIIDIWALNHIRYWPQEHNDVIQKLLRKSRKGTEIIYVPGNHDEFVRNFCDIHLGNISIQMNAVHIGVDNKIYFVTHGDQFDIVIDKMKWLAFLGSWAYDFSIAINVVFNRIRAMFGLPYWSLSAYLKYKVKEAVKFISDYENNLSGYAKQKNFDGIICGHIHHCNDTMINGVRYLNCGDWVESCTAIVEHYNGKFEIIK